MFRFYRSYIGIGCQGSQSTFRTATTTLSSDDGEKTSDLPNASINESERLVDQDSLCSIVKSHIATKTGSKELLSRFPLTAESKISLCSLIQWNKFTVANYSSIRKFSDTVANYSGIRKFSYSVINRPLAYSKHNENVNVDDVDEAGTAFKSGKFSTETGVNSDSVSPHPKPDTQLREEIVFRKSTYSGHETDSSDLRIEATSRTRSSVRLQRERNCLAKEEARLYESASHETGSQLGVEDSADVFGTLSDPQTLYEKLPGDEGDRRQEEYLNAQLARKQKPIFYEKQLEKLCKEGKLKEALNVFEVEMVSVGVKPTAFCYNVLINACGRVGYTKKAFSLYNTMKKRQLKVEDVVYTGLFNACANSPWLDHDGLKRAEKLRRKLNEMQVTLNLITYHSMIKAFGRCGDITTAFEVADEMVASGIRVTTETMNFLLQACLSDKKAGFRHALKVWRRMREIRLSPDIYSYNLLIRCIKECSSGEPELLSQLVAFPKGEPQQQIQSHSRGKQMVTVQDIKTSESQSEEVVKGELKLDAPKMEERSAVTTNSSLSEGKLPDLLGTSPVLGSAIGLSSLELASDRLNFVGGLSNFLKHMKSDNVKPNMKTFTMMLDCIPETKEAEEVLLAAMEDLGATPDSGFCNMLIKKRNMRGDFEAAKDVLNIMQEHHILMDLVTFGCLSLGCDKLYFAKQLLADMNEAGFRPNLEIMSALIKLGIVNHNYIYAIEMLQVMKDLEIAPNERLLRNLEKARKHIRQAIQKIENKDALSPHQQRKLSDMQMFLLKYSIWLKGNTVLESDHPWAQFKRLKDTENEENISSDALVVSGS